MFASGIIFFECLFIFFVSVFHVFYFRKKDFDYFGVFFLLFSLHGFYYALFFSEGIARFPHLFGTGLIFPFVHNPVLYFLFLKFEKPDFVFEKKHLFYFLPVLPWIAYLSPLFLLEGTEKKLLYEESFLSGNPLWIPGFYAFEILSLYMAVSFSMYVLRLYRLYKTTELLQSKKSEKIRRVSLSLFLWSVVIFSAYIFFNFGEIFSVRSFFQAGLAGIGFFSMVFIFMYMFFPYYLFSEKSEVLFSQFALKEMPRQMHFDLHDIVSRLEAVMEEKKPFLEERLSSRDLARLIEISPHQLSYALNTHYNERFQKYVNRYRVDYAKARLLEKKTRAVVEIAFESGFSSLSAFQSAFKEFSGQTPTEFRKNKASSEN